MSKDTDRPNEIAAATMAFNVPHKHSGIRAINDVLLQRNRYLASKVARLERENVDLTHMLAVARGEESKPQQLRQ